MNDSFGNLSRMKRSCLFQEINFRNIPKIKESVKVSPAKASQLKEVFVHTAKQLFTYILIIWVPLIRDSVFHPQNI